MDEVLRNRVRRALTEWLNYVVGESEAYGPQDLPAKSLATVALALDKLKLECEDLLTKSI